ncbi:hypothetical protein [Roseinatronobacter monicus]|uniref:Uncharacterized protein n=1 Tax=Roseinatronobacter monicus TaxID=393481 RepID=A0A543K4E7_9RHOB|nr:hypothetical protein [Roseinatronobacter monicus]TQM89958.1 hypothetical protein BD293_4277 [Roseinatronobacter monicus]
MRDVTPNFWLDQSDGDEDTPAILRSTMTAIDLPITGRYIDQVWQLGNAQEYLAFVTHGVLHEEQLSLLLIGESRLQEQIDISQPLAGTPPKISASVTQDHALEFQFPADRKWRLKVRALPAWHWPLQSPLITRQPRWRGRLKLTA